MIVIQINLQKNWNLESAYHLYHIFSFGRQMGSCAKNYKNLPSSLFLGINGLKGIMHISSNPLARKPVIPRKAPENLRSIGPGITEIDLKFSGGIFGSTGFPASGLLEKCMIPFKDVFFCGTVFADDTVAANYSRCITLGLIHLINT